MVSKKVGKKSKEIVNHVGSPTRISRTRTRTSLGRGSKMEYVVMNAANCLSKT